MPGLRGLPCASRVDSAAVSHADRPELEMGSAEGRARGLLPVSPPHGGFVKKSIIENLVPGGVGRPPRLPL